MSNATRLHTTRRCAAELRFDLMAQGPTLEAQLQANLNLMPAPSWYALPSGALTFVNKRTADYLGLPSDHPLRFGIDTGAAWDSHIPFLHPDDHEETRRVWSACLRTGCAGEVNFRIRNAEGGYRWFLSRAEPLRASDGTLLYWIGVNLDVDDATRAEDTLRKSEKELRDVIDTIPTLTWCNRADGPNEFLNKAWHEYTGLGPEVSHGRGWQVAFHPEDLPLLMKRWQELLISGEPGEIEARLRRHDGVYRWFLIRVEPFRDEAGTITRWFGTSADIDDRKRVEEALQRSEFYLREGECLAHMGSWAFNPSGFFDYWSQGLFQIFGLDPQQGAPTLERYLATLHPQDRESIAETIKTMHAEHCGCDVTKRIVRPDGEQRYIRCVGIPVVEGEVLKGFIGTAMDVTEQELLTQELERRQAYLTEAQKLSHTGSWAWSPETDNRYYSEECYRVLGFDPHGPPPSLESVIQRIHLDDQAYCREQLEKAIREKVDCEFDYRIVHPDKSVRDIHCIGHPVLDRSGDLVELVGTVIDITERKRADEERQAAERERERLHQLEDELAHINRVSMMGEMAASLAHEIKQPIAAAMTSANSCIEWLAHEPPNLDRARAAAAKIDKYGNRAAEIIDRIRSMYKKSPSQHELVDVNEVVLEIFTLLQGEAVRYSIEMRTELATELPKIMADRVQLQQVFMNLSLNAIEAMNESGGELTVRVHQQDGQLLFSISDMGPGLPVGSVDQIFSAFFTTKPQGSGMGLAISRSIVESHGGRLWATANEGRGATFHFTWPTELQ
jgi:PAS domain S-box-containing protein